jgi:DNA-binding XRE family transcriptional regulator
MIDAQIGGIASGGAPMPTSHGAWPGPVGSRGSASRKVRMTMNEKTPEAGQPGAGEAPVGQRPENAEPAITSPAGADEPPNDGEAPAIVGAVEAAMYMFVDAIDALPDPGDSKFLKRVEVILTGLRKLEASLSRAASRRRATPSVVVALSETRGHYNNLMERASAAPGSTLGQRIYTARRRADLSVEEAANGVGLRADLLAAIEAGEPTTQDETAKIKTLIAALER